MGFYDDDDRVKAFRSFVRSNYDVVSQPVHNAIITKYKKYCFVFDKLSLHLFDKTDFPSNEYCAYQLLGIGDINNDKYDNDRTVWIILDDKMKSMQKMFDEAAAEWYEQYQKSVKTRLMLALAIGFIVLIMLLLACNLKVLAGLIFMYLIALIYNFESTMHNTIYCVSKAQVMCKEWLEDDENTEISDVYIS